jgi:hypothetical protein
MLTLVHGPEARAALEDVPYRLDITKQADTDGQPLTRPPATVVAGGPHLTRVGKTPHRELARAAVSEVDVEGLGIRIRSSLYVSKTVFRIRIRIRIRIHRIYVFLGLPDPGPLVRGTVKSGNFVTFFAQNIFFHKIS